MNLTVFVTIVSCAALLAIFCGVKLFDLGSGYAKIIRFLAIPCGILLSLIAIFASARPSISMEIESGARTYDLIMIGSSIGFFAIGYLLSWASDIIMKRNKKTKDMSTIIAEEMEKQSEAKKEPQSKEAESDSEPATKADDKDKEKAKPKEEKPKTKAESVSESEAKIEIEEVVEDDGKTVPFVLPMLLDIVGGIITSVAVGFSFAIGASYGLLAVTAITLYLIMEKVAMVYRYEGDWSRKKIITDVSLTTVMIPFIAIGLSFLCNKSIEQDATFIAISCGYLLYHTAFHAYSIVKKIRKR